MQRKRPTRSSFPNSYTGTIYGCSSWPVMRASVAKRSTSASLPESSGERILMATSRWRSLSRARTTVLIPPMPMSSCCTKRSVSPKFGSLVRFTQDHLCRSDSLFSAAPTRSESDALVAVFAEESTEPSSAGGDPERSVLSSLGGLISPWQDHVAGSSSSWTPAPLAPLELTDTAVDLAEPVGQGLDEPA